MKAIILAAGEGTRLKPFTDNNPKCLVPVNGKSILDIQIDVMKSCGISDINVVSGHLSNMIKRYDVKHYENKEYATTNMVWTLWCARNEFNDDLIISYGDIIYNEKVLQKLIDSDKDISVVVDMNWEKYWKLRFDDPLKDAEAFNMDQEKRIQVIGQKANKISDIQAGYIGLIKAKKKSLHIIENSISNAIKLEAEGVYSWGIEKSFKKAYMTDFLQGLINEGNDIFAVCINGGWLEIDSNKDHKIAEELFLGGQVSPII